ncbi:hypothetical protein AAE478_001228 [Parahypoxylon ruwenzoriense]
MPELTFQAGARRTASELAADYAPIIRGKIIFITGVSPGGLGAAFVRAIAPMRPAMLILAGRNLTKTQQTADEVSQLSPETKVHILHVDLSSLSSVVAASNKSELWADVPHIDVFINNAAIIGAPRTITAEGYELHFATNYLGPWLLTNLLMPKIVASPKPRIINVGSDGHILSPIRFDDPNFQDEELYNKWIAYGQSKTAIMLMAVSLADKLTYKANLLAFSVHPGAVTTNLGSHLDWKDAYAEMARTYRLLGHAQGWKEGFQMITPEEGAATYVYAAFHQDLLSCNGGYLLDCRPGDPYDKLRVWATDSTEAMMLWERTEALTGTQFPYYIN